MSDTPPLTLTAPARRLFSEGGEFASVVLGNKDAILAQSFGSDELLQMGQAIAVRAGPPQPADLQSVTAVLCEPATAQRYLYNDAMVNDVVVLFVLVAGQLQEGELSPELIKLFNDTAKLMTLSAAGTDNLEVKLNRHYARRGVNGELIAKLRRIKMGRPASETNMKHRTAWSRFNSEPPAPGLVAPKEKKDIYGVG